MQNESSIREAVRGALLAELYTTVKPGLVDLHDNGAHADMNVGLFEKSTAAVVPYLCDMYAAGVLFAQGTGSGEDGGFSGGKQPEAEANAALFCGLRKIGTEAEKAMFDATGNVNTHKGIIFSMGLLCAAAGTFAGNSGHPEENGNAPEAGVTAQELCARASEIAYPVLTRELSHPEGGRRGENKAAHTKAPTHGEKLFESEGITGVRGEALMGFPCLTGCALPALQEAKRAGASENDAALHCLLSVMAVLDDTNVLSRGGKEGARFVKETARAVLARETTGSPAWKDAIDRFNEDCIRKNLSPGGAADVLANTLFVIRAGGILPPSPFQ